MPNPKEENLHLYTLTDKELAEIYASLYLKDEITRRLLNQAEAMTQESSLLKRVAQNFTERYSHHLRAEILNLLDSFLDEQLDEEVMWMQIEEALNNINNPEEAAGNDN